MKPIEIVADGVTYSLDLPEADHDYIQKTIATTGRPYEEAMLIDLASAIAPGELVLDIGANCGNHALYLSCIAGAEVHAFEPDADLCASIRSSAALNGVEHLMTIHQVGVGDEDALGRLVQTAEHNRGAQRLERVADNAAGTRIIRLDDLEFPKTVRAMKIDVEGMEHDVLRGARRLIEDDRPDIYVECQTRRDFERIHTWLTQFRYHYVATFNATPTHHFKPSTPDDEGDRFEQIVKQQVAATYYDRQAISRLRESLADANLKYRGVSAQLGPLKEQLRLAASSELQCRERLEEAQNRVSESNYRLEEMGGALSAKSARLEEVESQLEAGLRASQLLSITAEGRETALRDLRDGLSIERKRVQELERIVEQNNALTLAAESRVAEQTRQWLDDRSRLERQLHIANKRVLRTRRKAKFYSARAEAALDQATRTALRLSGVESTLAEAETKSAEVARRLIIERGMVSRLQKQLASANQRVKSLETAAVDDQDRIKQLSEALSMRQSQLDTAERKLKSLRESITYRLGRVLSESAKSPLKAMMLPVRLSKMALDHSRRRAVQGVVLSATTAEINREKEILALEPTSSITNRAPEIQALRQLKNSNDTAALRRTAGRNKKAVRVAAIMDDFTVQSFSPECDLHELSLDNYISELQTFSPSLVFLESAWRGKGNAWGNKVAQTAAEIREIIQWANQNSVPVVLWNKEDPVHYSTFLNTAKLVDHVFTTDIDCIQKYKGDLGHDRVHFLPFACQPVLHNPLELYKREPAISFAGAYYRRYPARTRDLESFIAEIPSFAQLEIFDRNFNNSDEQYMFPDEYKKYIVGTLDGTEIDLAYKGYEYAINLNSVKESQSMFARRAFELLASNTIVVSNYSRGLQLMLGDIPVVADSGRVVVRELEAIQGGRGRKRRNAGLRKVMLEHTYEHRLEHVMSKAGIPYEASRMPVVEVFSLVSGHAELTAVREAALRQVGVKVILRVYTKDDSWVASCRPETDVSVGLLVDLQAHTLDSLVDGTNLAAVMVPADYYGENYLQDLALAGRYSSAVIVGKGSFFDAGNDGLEMECPSKPYTATSMLPIRSSLVLQPSAMGLRPVDWLLTAERGVYKQDLLLGMEVFDYCRNGGDLAAADKAAVDSGFPDVGLKLSELEAAADNIDAPDFIPDQERLISGEELAQLFLTRSRPGVQTETSDGGWTFRSTLADGVHDYLYASKLLDLESLAVDGKLHLHLEADPGLNLQIAIIFYDGDSERITGIVRGANQNHTLDIPSAAVALKVGMRISSSGESTLRRVFWTHKNVRPAFIASRTENLVITNRYPSYDDLYKNGFVHSRVRRYIQMGVPTEVFVLDEGSPLRFREFEGITVISGSSEVLDTLLRCATHRSIALHFVNESMWGLVRNLPQRPRVAIWAHGADIQMWSRRSFLYESEEEIQQAKISSEVRRSLWQAIFRGLTPEMSVVFVSKWLASTALEDLGVTDGRRNSFIIHNPIDTEKFAYQEKPSTHRYRVLSIRPYTSSVYANDLAVQAILILASEPEFTDMKFRFVGDGPLFDDVTRPLQSFPNVILDRRFLTQDQIVEMHREYGIFLCPSRMDTQGVSRDEAMASGLVPVTTATAAIPEFANDSCAELTEPENPIELAAGIMRLVRSEETFRRKSKAAAARVRAQSEASTVVPQELELLGYPGINKDG